MSPSPAASGTKALARGDPLGSVTSGVRTRFVFQSIPSRFHTVLSAGRGESALPGDGVRRCPGGRFREGSRAPGRAGRVRAGCAGGPSRGAAGGACICRGGRGRARAPLRRQGLPWGGDTRGERKRATCSCDRGFDLHPGSGHSPFQGELERLGDTAALSPRLIKSLAVGRYFHIQAGQNRNADQLL